jgi:carbonic anhydrase
MTENVSPHEALRRLRDGNARYTGAAARSSTLTTRCRPGAHVGEQHPFATVLSCSDSRVPVEMIFDQGIGDLFVVRVAGNVVAPPLLGSVEFAASVLSTGLIVVMGHTFCGAVKAALDVLRDGAELPSENIRDIVERITPALGSALAMDGTDTEVLSAAVRANVRAVVSHVRHGSPMLEDMGRSGKVAVVGAEYDLASGVVEFFDLPAGLEA